VQALSLLSVVYNLELQVTVHDLEHSLTSKRIVEIPVRSNGREVAAMADIQLLKHSITPRYVLLMELATF